VRKMVRDYNPYYPFGENRTLRLYRDIMDSAFGGFKEYNSMKTNETATITLRKDGKIYRVQIQDITDEMESKDEVISVEVKKENKPKKSSKKNGDSFDNSYYTE